MSNVNDKDKHRTVYLDWLPVKATWTPAGPTEHINTAEFPMVYYEKTKDPAELRSLVENPTITHAASDFPKQLIKKGKAQELRSKFT
jgi:hypothetical protein